MSSAPALAMPEWPMLKSLTSKLRHAARFFVHPRVPEGVRQDLHKKATENPHRWKDGDPLSEARNAHYTNTPEELKDAFSKDFNFLEGDVWLEGVARRIPLLDEFREPIMAHDFHDVEGLKLSEWLELGKASGKGLKLDIKGSAAIPKVIEAIEEADIPEERLILNADMVDGPGWVTDTKFKVADKLLDIRSELDEMQLFRDAFPKATLAVGLYTRPAPAGTSYSKEQLEAVSDIADELGGPITFPLRAEFVTPEVVAELKPHGTVSVWNNPRSFLPGDLDEARQKFRDMGVDGMIDLRTHATLDDMSDSTLIAN